MTEIPPEYVQRIFKDALKRTPADRTAVLDEACGDDAALRAEVESLLAHHVGVHSAN